MIKYHKLSAAERVLAITVGEGRYTRARAKGIPDARAAKDANFIDVNGAAGEIALAAILCKNGLITAQHYEDSLLQISSAQAVSSAQGTDYGDLAIYGLNIDVKTTHYPNGMLWLHARKLYSPIDYYSLVVGDYREGGFIYKGSLSADEIRATFSARDGKYPQGLLKELPFIDDSSRGDALDLFNRS